MNRPKGIRRVGRVINRFFTPVETVSDALVKAANAVWGRRPKWLTTPLALLLFVAALTLLAVASTSYLQNP